MKPENKKFLDDNRHHHTTLVKAFYLRHLDGNTRSMMQQVMAEEFQPGYAADLWCPTCCADMVTALYRRYDDWLAANPEPAEVAPVIEVTPEPPAEAEQLPEPEEPLPPIQIAANFPAHNKNHRRK